MPERARGLCNTPENSRIFGYIMGFIGLGIFWFCYRDIGKLFSEQFSNLATYDIIIPLMPFPYAVACIIWLLGVFQQWPKSRLVAMVCFGVVLLYSIVIIICLPSEEYLNRGAFIILMAVCAGFSLVSGIISHISMKTVEPSYVDDY